MTTHVLQFVELSAQDRKAAKAFDKLGKGDQVEVRVRLKSGKDQVLRLPWNLPTAGGASHGCWRSAPKAAALLETALAEDQELSPNDAANILCHSDISASIAARS
jgi:hypothetical protein